MAWIKTLDSDEASGFVESVYEQFSRGEEETVSNIVSAHSLSERAMKSFAAFSELLFAPSELDRRTKEMINTVVSTLNECEY